jgi:pyruvate kinase
MQDKANDVCNAAIRAALIECSELNETHILGTLIGQALERIRRTVSRAEVEDIIKACLDIYDLLNKKR